MVPQGGHTGLAGGAMPSERGDEVVISLARLNRVRHIDPLNFSLTAESGCILVDLQQAAEEADRLLPLSLGAESSCQIGGNISTNAGGVHVVRYGNTRDLVLGLEVVLPDGRVLNNLNSLRKDNTGYDLKHFFIGAEGTLGIITAATLKLFPRPKEIVSALVGVPDVVAAVALFGRLQEVVGDTLSAFEIMPRVAIEMALDHVTALVDPLGSPHPWYLLIELSSSSGAGSQNDLLEQVLERALEEGQINDATIAASQTQAKLFWRLREGVVEAQRFEGGSIKHDVSVPISSIPRFIKQASGAVEDLIPGARPLAFGHIGDGNIHFNVSQPPGQDRQAFMERWATVNHLVHDIVNKLNGSISAEHGLGKLKLREHERLTSPLEIEIMRRVKTAFDPHNLMNPGKVLSL